MGEKYADLKKIDEHFTVLKHPKGNYLLKETNDLLNLLGKYVKSKRVKTEDLKKYSKQHKIEQFPEYKKTVFISGEPVKVVDEERVGVHAYKPIPEAERKEIERLFETTILKNLKGKKYVVQIIGGNVRVLGAHEETRNVDPKKLEEELRKYAAGQYRAAHKIVPKRTFTVYSGKKMAESKRVEPRVAKIFVYNQVSEDEKKNTQKFFEEYHKILEKYED